VGRWETSVHERLVRHSFKGMTADRLRELGERFMAIEGAHLVRKAGLRRLAWHKQQGHRCLLVSASIDVYLGPWGIDAGFDDVLGTRLELDDQGVLTGRFAGEPCWGSAKVRRLQSHLGALSDYTVFAYGNGRGDRDLLALADHGFLVQGEFEISRPLLL
jgi:HAD superfamily hydrolase (TIGR01490 family)